MYTGSIPHIGYDSEVRSLETVHRLRYFRFCNVLHIWTIRAIPTYRVYRLCDTCTVHSQGCIQDFFLGGGGELLTVE